MDNGQNVSQMVLFGITVDPHLVLPSQWTSMSACELFARYFTDNVWQLMVEETNRYTVRSRQNLSDHSRAWTPMTVPDMKAFIGMLILMGMVKSPQLDLY